MRYIGSKNRLSKEIVPIIQSYIKSDTKGYLEPFVGGANLIDKIQCTNKIGVDIHEELIELLKYVQEFSSLLPERILESTYNDVKNNKEKYEKWYLGLVGFCSSFGAKYFGGYARDSKEDNKMYYWFEHSWNDEKGIHEYNNMNKLLNDVENKFKESHKEELIGKYKTYIYEYEQPNYNISCDQFYNFIFKQRKIYNYQLIDSTKEDEDRLKNYKLKSIIDYAKDISKNEIKQINSYIEENIPKQIDEYKNIIYNNEIIGSVLVNKIEKGLLIDEVLEEYVDNLKEERIEKAD